MSNQAFRIPGQVVLGIVVIFMGIIFLLDNLGVADAGAVLRFWPIIFVVFGTLKILRTRSIPGYVVGGIFIFIGLLMLSHRLGFIHLYWRDWWPLFLILIGISVIVKSLYRKKYGIQELQAEEVTKTMDVMAILGGHRYKSDVPDFRGGEITSVMGGCEVDLRQASIKGEVVINVFSFWGGTEIKVPGDWNVVVECMPILGGIDDKSSGAPGSGKRLIIKGTVIMGGVEIRN